MELKNFTAFSELNLEFSRGINIFIGANGTGKTHILKLLYAACDITRSKKEFSEKLDSIFMPYEGRFGRLAHRKTVSVNASINLFRSNEKLCANFSNHTKTSTGVKVTGETSWNRKRIECAYIPVKEMLAHAPGFRSLYSGRHIQFEEIYYDIVDRAYLPLLKGPIDNDRKRLLQNIEKAIEGKVTTKGEFFFLKNPQGELEFSLLAEGLRKLALLWLLIQNGTLLSGTILFWDEPEANINPRIMGLIVEILLELQRLGIQVFLTTHDFVILKEFDLRRKSHDSIIFHSLYRNSEAQNICVHSVEHYLDIHPNTLSDTFADIYDRDIERAFKGGNA
jgi:ABC-type lipoprotein export system ATPase subunit